MIRVVGLLFLGVLIGIGATHITFSKPTLTIPTEFHCTHQAPNSKVKIKEVARKVSEYFGNQ